MLWVRGLVFTLLVPCVVGVYFPWRMYNGNGLAGGWSQVGWPLLAVGSVVYLLCLFRFLASGGTPAIFFTRPLKPLIGEEPPRLVQEGLYRYSRNPMYVGVLLVVLGQAILFASLSVALYGVALWLGFHLTVVLLEEPHLRNARGPSYDEYCRRVPRWLGPPG
jgi:protein-S-isoprenylcysteine O-methyltransferase Ste14